MLSRGSPLVAVCGHLLAVLSLVVEQRPGASGIVAGGSRVSAGSVVLVHRLCYFITRWHMGSSRTRIKLVTPALQDGFLTTGAPGKPPADVLIWDFCPPRLRKSISVVLNPLVCGPLLQQPQETPMSTKCQTEGSCGKQEGNAAGTESKSLEESKEETGRNAS